MSGTESGNRRELAGSKQVLKNVLALTTCPDSEALLLTADRIP